MPKLKSFDTLQTGSQILSMGVHTAIVIQKGILIYPETIDEMVEDGWELMSPHGVKYTVHGDQVYAFHFKKV